MGPALPASHGPRTWDGGQVPCEGRPDTRWSGQAPSREPRGRSRFRPADCIRTEEITLDTVNLIQGGLNAPWRPTCDSVGALPTIRQFLARCTRGLAMAQSRDRPPRCARE